MKISNKVQYATRALLDVAVQKGTELIPLKEIAARQQIPLPYLEQIVSPLSRAGIIKSTRGPRGGIILARPPEQIKLSDIVEAIEGPISLVKCLANSESCLRSGACVSQDVWRDIQSAIDGLLESITLKNLVQRQRKMERTQPAMYNI